MGQDRQTLTQHKRKEHYGHLADFISIPAKNGSFIIGDEPHMSPPLGPLGKVNLFVGANNSGKSRAARALCGELQIAGQMKPRVLEDTLAKTINQGLFSGVKSRVENSYPHLFVELPEWLKTELNWLRTTRLELFNKEVGLRLMRFLVRLNSLDAERFRSSLTRELGEMCQELVNIAKRHFQENQGFYKKSMEEPAWQRLYIPTLRTLRPIGLDPVKFEELVEQVESGRLRREFQQLSGDLLGELTRRQYFKDGRDTTIFTGQTIYADVESLLRGNLEARSRLAEFERFLSRTFFSGEAVALIPKKNESELTVKIGKRAERSIHALGDGIQMLLLLTFPLFQRSKERVLVCMEEPELFLHPWLQRVLMELLASNQFPDHQYFLTTHSNHLLDLTLDVDDVAVFAFEEEQLPSEGAEQASQFRVRAVSREDRKPLELLGVRNSSVLLSNCTIWVEGITDRRYLARWLELYPGGSKPEPKKTFREDLHYSFVEYGGGNITHWSFLDEVPDAIEVDRLCGKLFLITDHDGAEENKKAERQEELRKRLKEHYHPLPVREIENLVTPNVLKKVLSKYGEDPGRLPAFNAKDYASVYLGRYIEDTLLKQAGGKQRAGSYKAKSGTITGKVDFCQKVVEATETWDDVSPEAKELVEKLYKFIADNNRGAVR